MKLKNSVLIFSLFVSLLFLAVSFNPANAQEAGFENGRCNSNEDCILGNVCGDDDIGCYCSQSICVARGAPGEACDTNRPCQTGSECFGLPGEDYCIPREEITAFTNFQRHIEGSACPQGLEAACASLAQPQQAPAPEAPVGGDATPPAVQQLTNPLGTGADIPEIIARIIKAAVGLVGSVGLLMFLYGGFTWMTAGGNEKRVGEGKQILTWAVLGLIVIFTSYAVLSFVIEKLTTPTNVQQNQPQP